MTLTFAYTIRFIERSIKPFAFLNTLFVGVPSHDLWPRDKRHITMFGHNFIVSIVFSNSLK